MYSESVHFRRSFSGRVLVALFAVVLTVPAWSAQKLSQQSRDELWAAAFEQYQNNPRVVYHNGSRELPEYPGFVISNEESFYTATPPLGRADLMVGFGTTVNFNLWAAREGNALLLADQSPEVQATLASFWRTLFLAARTPEEWVAAIGGIRLKPGETIDSLFERLSKGERRNGAALTDFDKHLATLVRSGKITDVDRAFTMAVLREQQNIGAKPSFSGMYRFLSGGPAEVKFFRGCGSGCRIMPETITTFLWQKKQREAIQKHMDRTRERMRNLSNDDLLAYGYPTQEETERLFQQSLENVDRLSFLTPDGYAKVRSLFEDGKDFYAQTDIYDEKFWEVAGKFARARGMGMTDLYLTNIPGVLGDPLFFAQLTQWMHKVPGKEVTVYESKLEAPHPIRTVAVQNNGLPPKKARMLKEMLKDDSDPGHGQNVREIKISCRDAMAILSLLKRALGQQE